MPNINLHQFARDGIRLERGYPIQEQGVTEYPGLYFLGLHWLHKLKSGLFLGVGEDAEYIAEHMAVHSPEKVTS